MDYTSIHGPGISNFSSPSPHRLPTVSAAQALQDLNSSPTRCVSTGLKELDAVLQNRDPLTISDGETFYGGVPKGKVTEVWGPPGVGKTALGMQLAASVLHAGERVIWVDASHPIPGPRFSQILDSFQPLHSPSTTTSSTPSKVFKPANLIDNLTHFSTPTLSHLIALLNHQTPDHPPPSTSLIVVDSFSTLISNAFPRTMDSNSTPRKPGVPNPSARKFPILQHIINSLQKLAATHNIAIVLFSQCVTKMRPGAGAVLIPAINTTAWEQGLGCRVALFRDWGWIDEEGNAVDDVRLAEVKKAEGASCTGRTAGFSIRGTGLYPLLPRTRPTPNNPSANLSSHSHPQNSNAIESPLTLSRPHKRKLSATDLEIPDSEGEDDEDYGWAEEDEEDIPAMPPQWQGSEDILVPPPGELEGDGDDPGEDDVEETEGVDSEKGIRLEEIGDSEDELA